MGGASHGNDGGIHVAARAEPPHVQINQRHHDEGEGGGGQPCRPVVHAEVLEEEHGPPIVEGWLLQPGMAVEIRRDTGAEAVFQSVGGVEVAQHLVGDLGIAGLVGAHQAHAVAAQEGSKPIGKKENGKSQKQERFENARPGRQPPMQFLGRIWIAGL